MLDFLFAYGGYAPHEFGIARNPVLLWSHIGADLLVALCCFATAIVIVIAVRRRQEVDLRDPAFMVAACVTLFGLTHLIGMVSFFYPVYGLHAAIKVATALVSVLTVRAIIRGLPEILRIPAPSQLLEALDMAHVEVLERRAVESRLRESDAALRRKVRELRTANAEMQEFAYAASHDLRSPPVAVLSWLRGFAHEYDAVLDDAARAEIAEVSVLLQRMKRQTAAVFAFSRIVRWTLDQPEPVDMAAVFAEALDRHRDRIEALGASVEIGSLPVVNGHRAALFVFADALIDNALKFRRGGTSPRIEVSTCSDGAGPGEAVICVADNGIGIAAKDADRIFTVFSRLNHPGEYEGTGLGLTLCRRVVSMHGGEIWLRTDGRKGAAFCATLPCVEGTGAADIAA